MTEPEGTPPATPAATAAGPASATSPAPDSGPAPDAGTLPDAVPDLDLGLAAAPDPSPWRDVLLAPFRGGTLLGFGALAVLAAMASWLEGGSTADAHLYRQLGQAVLGIVSVAVLAIYARRVVLCMLENDRPVPWGADVHDDATTWKHDVGSFAAVLIMSLVPAVILNTIALVLGAPGWLSGIVAFLGLLAGALHLPFAALSVVLRNGPLGAGWGGTRRAWKANARAARTAVLPALAFLALVVVAHILGGILVEAPLEGRRPIDDHSAGRDLGRLVVFGLRLAAVWSALCTFRVAGMLARDVPEIREVLE